MSNIRERERETYDNVWAVPAYSLHSPGEHYLPIFLDMAKTTMRISVLDAGCGSGKGALALKAAGFAHVHGCDLTAEGLIDEARGAFPFTEVCLWEDLRPAVGFYDFVYCCDVMEHIPTTFAMLVVSRLLEVAKRGVFFSISFQPDVMGAWVGKHLHQTLQSFVDWRDQLSTVGKLVEARDLINSGCFLVAPK